MSEPQPSTSTSTNERTGRRKSDTTNQFFEEPKKLRGFAKHAVLKSYLDAWFPIMLSDRFGGTLEEPRELVYVDGFAGPGKYEDGEEEMDKEDRLGSPILVYKALAQHTNLKDRNGKVFLIFFEAKKDLYLRLEKNIQEAKRDYPIQHNVKIEIEVHRGDFNELIDDVLGRFRDSPVFVFADPFGYNIKMSTLQKILSSHGWLSPRELLLNLMDGRLRSFINYEKNHNSQDALLGVGDPNDPEDNWREKCKTATPDEKLNIISDFYIRRLQEGHENKMFSEFVPSIYIPSQDKNLVLKFAMKDQRNHHVYHLIYVTCHIKGFQEMKLNMSRKSMDSKSFVFSEWMSGKNRKAIKDFKFEKSEIAKDVLKLVVDKFSLPDQEHDVKGKEIDHFVWLETPYAFNVKVQLKKVMKEAGIKFETKGEFPDKMFTFPKFKEISSELDLDLEAEADQNGNEQQNGVVASSSGNTSPPKKRRKK